MNTTITQPRGHRIWDSRGRPTIEVEVTLAGGAIGRGVAPAGASRGTHEAVDLRDGGAPDGGYGVVHALHNVNEVIAPRLRGVDASNQHLVDEILCELDASPTKAVLGGNATIAVSMAVLATAAAAAGVPLWRYLAADRPVRMPLPQIQIFGGGAHADRRVDIQDFLVMPVGANTFDEALSMVSDIYRSAGELMARRGRRFGVADEGGWWPAFDSNEDALRTLTEAIDSAGYGDGAAMIALDIAASEFGRAGRYRLDAEDREFDTADWLAQLVDWLDRYPIISIEDPVAEDDRDGMRAFTAAVGHRVQIIGDDYLVSNVTRVSAAIADRACNAVLLKPNQAGTISETFATFEQAQKSGWGTVVSARSGETEDTFITHLAIGWNAGQLKVGSFARSERMAKWNEGLRIERQRFGIAGYAGRDALPIPGQR
jgi:enolase